MDGSIALVAEQNIIALINGAIQACITHSKVLYALVHQRNKETNNWKNRFM